VFYTIYKTTNKINGKIYIGKHQTKNLEDNYIGSGKILQNAIAKYGIENFDKEILHVFDTEDEMNAKEVELVTEDFVKENANYNLCPGGQGGFGYINQNNIGNIGWKHNLVDNTHQRKGGNRTKELYPKGVFAGKVHTPETKEKISKKVKNAGDSLKSWKGFIWITDGTNNKRVGKYDIIPIGWYKGRIVRKN
jgi:hypothetical protein